MRDLILFSASALILAGCSPASQAPADGANEAVSVPVAKDAAIEADANRAAELATRGGDGRPVALAPIAPADGSAVPGELACGFTASGDDAAILLGKGFVASSAQPMAVVRAEDGLHRLTLSNGQGFASLRRGGDFVGPGFTITLSPGESVADASESPAQHAELLVQREDGAKRTYRGMWRCGP
ncbi:hypothetical protein [Sphingosinithalassobacter portus]|uniref:hypothetical protein n=1 Tax=Stakelama portus TaxID=2676234 RepID=UPI000D6E7E33|nr:hypothetical protein [Sphingosinithalassobacter portus]